MARIRSIHPGLFTDESFVTLSFPARILLLGIWTEADDHGVFEWKPISLKMRLFPADDVSVVALLAEIVTAGAIRECKHEDKPYGAVRNFCKYQRPKKPSYKHPFPPEWVTYSGLKTVKTEPVPNQFPTRGVKPSQMKDGGGRREEGGDNKKEIIEAPQSAAKKTIKNKEVNRGTRIDPSWAIPPEFMDYAMAKGLSQVETARNWPQFKNHHEAKGTISKSWFASWRTWVGNALKFLGRTPKDEPAPKVEPLSMTVEQWKSALTIYASTNNWQFPGAPPGQPGCLVPSELTNKQPDLI